MTHNPPTGSTDPDTPQGRLDAAARDLVKDLGIELRATLRGSEDRVPDFPRYVDPSAFPPVPPKPPETPIERLRRLASPKTRGVPAGVILEHVVEVLADIRRDVDRLIAEAVQNQFEAVEPCCRCTCGTTVGKHAPHCDTVRCQS